MIASCLAMIRVSHSWSVSKYGLFSLTAVTSRSATADGGMPLDRVACMVSRSEAPEDDMPLSLVSVAGRLRDPWNRLVAMIPGHRPVAPMFAPARCRSADSTSVMARIACLQILYMIDAATT